MEEVKDTRSTPIRRLEGLTYWVIESPEAIHDFIDVEVRKEWEADAKSEYRDPKDDPWLRTLTRREWRLEIMDMTRIKLDTDIMNFTDPERGYVFLKSLEKRSSELRQSIEFGGVVLSPLIIRNEGTQLVDGYCRYVTFKAMSVSRIYTYVGSL